MYYRIVCGTNKYCMDDCSLIYKGITHIFLFRKDADIIGLFVHENSLLQYFIQPSYVDERV